MVFRFLFHVLIFLQLLFLPRWSMAFTPPAPALLPGFPVIAGDKVLIVWTPVPGAASYKVYKDGKFLEAITGATYTGALPASAEEVRFQVSAVSEAGEEGRLSAPWNLRLGRIPPPAELAISVNPDQPAVLLTWMAVRGAFGYNVYRVAGPGEQVLLHSGVDLYFRDRSVRKGSRYGYAVAAIDRFGREGEKSRPEAVEVPAQPRPPQAAVKTARKRAAGVDAKGKAKKETRHGPSPLEAAFREVMSIEKIGDVPLGEVSYLGPGGDNVIFVVRPAAREIHAMEPAGGVVMTLGPAALDAAGAKFIPHKLDVGPEGRLVVSDVVNGTVACFGPQGGLLWSRKIDPPPATEVRVWEGFPSSAKTLAPSPSSVLVLPGEILVTDQRLQLIYRLGLDGEFRGSISHYRKGTNTWRLRRVGELESVPGRGVLFTFPLVRKVLLVDGEFAVLSEIVGSGKDRSAGFLGLHGMRFIPGEGVLLTDPTSGRIKMYDPETGEHIRDLTIPALSSPNMAVWTSDEKLWVYLARQNRIAVLAREEAGK